MKETFPPSQIETRAEIAREAWFGGYPHSAKLADLPDAKREVWLAVVRAVDASRPELTEEQMRAVVCRAIAEKSKQGMANMRVCIAEHELTCAVAAALLRASRGETGPAPTWGEQAIAEHHRAAEPEPFENIEQLPRAPAPERRELVDEELARPVADRTPRFWPGGLTAAMHAARGAAALAGVDANEQRSRLHDGDPAQRSSCPDSSLLNFGEALLAGKTPRTP